MRSFKIPVVFLIAVCLGLPSLLSAEEWVLEYIDLASRFNEWSPDHALAADPATGDLALAYGTAGLLYAVRTGGQWTVEAVDQDSGVGSYTSLAMRDGFKPVVSYYDSDRNRLKVAYRQAGGWQIEVVDAQGDVGRYSSVAVDDLDRIVVAYRDETNRDLKYAVKELNNWTVQTVESSGNAGEYASIAVDADGAPHIAYNSVIVGDALRYAVFQDGSWSAERVEVFSNSGSHASIAVGPDGDPYIVHYNRRSGDLKIAVRRGQWEVYTIDSAGDVGQQASIAIAADGSIHLLYQDTGQRNLKYATNATGTWISEVIDNSGQTGLFTSIAVAGNEIACSYYDPEDNAIRVATGRAGSWSIVTAVQASETGRYASLIIDQEEVMHLAYYDGDPNNDLIYSYYDEFGWHPSRVDTNGDVGQHASLALDQDNRPHLAYYDATRADLKYAVREGDNWRVERVNFLGLGNVGRYPSIQIDSLGQPLVAYRNDSLGLIEYSWRDAEAWHTEVPSFFGDVGLYNSSQIDFRGFRHLSFAGNGGKVTHYAFHDGGRWYVEDILSSAYEGVGTSLALDAASDPHVSFVSGLSQGPRLTYSFKKEGVWTSQQIDPYTDGGHGSSLQLDVNDFPFISYYDIAHDDLRFAQKVGESWAIETVAPGGDAGAFSSLVLDQSSNPLIAYYDADRRTLRLAQKASAPIIWYVEPGEFVNYGLTEIQEIRGTGFFNEDFIIFIQNQAGEIIACQEAVPLSTTRASCTIDLYLATTGSWDLVVQTRFGADVLVDGLTITEALPEFEQITPEKGHNIGSLQIKSLTGDYFVPEKSRVLLLNQEGQIEATEVEVLSQTELACQFDLTGAATGSWDLLVGTPLGIVTTPGAFAVTHPAPKLSAVTPNRVPDRGTVIIEQVTGEYFLAGQTQVRLELDGEVIEAKVVEVDDPANLYCEFYFNSIKRGEWTFVVETPWGSASLEGAVTVDKEDSSPVGGDDDGCCGDLAG